jgi:ABC-type transport system substrate-binding protein
MKVQPDPESLIDEEIRQAVAFAIDTRTVVDAGLLGTVIAGAFSASPRDIALRVAEAAVAAHVPILLSGS